jgi:hypothetical protein
MNLLAHTSQKIGAYAARSATVLGAVVAAPA